MRKISELESECRKLGIFLDCTIKHTKKELLNLLKNYYLAKIEKPSWGLLKRLEIESPNLCFNFKNLKEKEKENILNSEDWLAEEKVNGCRMLMFYHPMEGFTFFSRNISVKNYLPVDYTSKILLRSNMAWMDPKEFAGAFNFSFILDCEIIVDKNIDTSRYIKGGERTGSLLNACTTILSLDDPISRRCQMEQATLKFKVFDCLYYNNMWITDKILSYRKHFQKKVMSVIQDILPVESTKTNITNKKEFFRDITSKGGEGIVLKNLNKPYIATSSRPRDVMVKYKRTMSDTALKDIDAFIMGYTNGTSDSLWTKEGLIAGLKMGVYLKGEEERDKPYWIATVSGIPLKERRKMTLNIGSITRLNPKFYSKVYVIDGQAVSSKNFRFTHASIDWGIGERMDKSRHECVIDKSFIMEQVGK